MGASWQCYRVDSNAAAHANVSLPRLLSQGEECHAEDGKLFAYVYTMEDPRYKTLAEAYNMFTEKFGEGEAPSDAAKEVC